MMTLVWTCDRCGTTAAECREERTCWPSGWELIRRRDVCPGCLTDTERADCLLRDIEATEISF